ncbi:hypothetical protein Poly24_47390 [Rosistilla carotiformis]|uniref:TIGR03000 domain-containing protein n=1 Tax=Rosistilla carotiformis TaxID=2528017 RepID=A0A518JZN1_9BACT|nr:hypothetical protein [Rosistilla carotiformis]QDV71006.1 hypothetical protein Poly24_47390 [Rosistilla carotiformis]
MPVRSQLIFVAALCVIFAWVAEEASARGRLCKKRMSRCGVSRSASWGGSYGSCGTPVVRCCPPPCTRVVNHGASFGSTGGSGGSYASAGSAGGWVMPANEVIHQPTYVTPEPIPASEDSFPREVIVPEFGDDGDSILEGSPQEHRHHHTYPSTTQSRTGQPSHARIAASAPKHAFLVLRDVPADAEIYLLGTKMTARGALRRYRIPVDATGQAYDYQVELKLPGRDHQPAIATPQVQSGETTELWVAESGDQLVFIDEQHPRSESGPLAVR